jgi:glycosyltransferase involved in cell wall biosynthesis
MLTKLMDIDERIKYISLSQHNFINARNAAFRNANSKYIALIDSDDKCSPDKLEEQVKYLDEHPEVDVVGCKIKFGNKTSHLSIPKSTNDWDNDYFQEEIKTENISMLLHFPSIMIRKSTLDRIFPNGIYFYPELCNGGEDQIFLYTLYLNGAKFANVSKPTYLYNYLEYDDAISASIGKHFNEDNFIFKYIHNKPFEERLKVVKELYNKYSK